MLTAPRSQQDARLSNHATDSCGPRHLLLSSNCERGGSVDATSKIEARVSLLRGKGLVVAAGYPCAALVAAAVWLRAGEGALETSLPSIAVLIVLAALAERISIVVAPRTQVSIAAGFIAAAALVGGPIIGALAGASTEALSTDSVWRKRFAWAGACALEGFAVGVMRAQFPLNGSGVEALAVAAAGLAAGLLVNLLNVVLVGLDRRISLRSELAASWRPTVLMWALPLPALAAFLLTYRVATTVAVALAVGLLLALWLGNRLRLGLEQRLVEERQRSRHDALTGAPNRYALAEALAAEHARIMRGGRPGAVCFLDLDRFREVNTLGYQAGDELLVQIYQRFRERLRTSDQLFRWGGDEFVVIAPDQPDLHELAERLRQLFKAEPFAICGTELKVTGSVGAAVLDESRTSETSLKIASRLVRVAKEKRDSVRVEAVPVKRVPAPPHPVAAT